MLLSFGLIEDHFILSGSHCLEAGGRVFCVSGRVLRRIGGGGPDRGATSLGGSAD